MGHEHLNDFDSITHGEGSKIEFKELFTSRRVKVKFSNGELTEAYLWRLKQKTLNECNILSLQLPGYQSGISKISQIVIGKGIIEKNQKERSGVHPQLTLFLKSLPKGQFVFLQKMIRLLSVKGCFLNVLFDFGEENEENVKEKDYKWITISPENFGVVSKSNRQSLAEYVRQSFVYLGGKTTELTVLKDEFCEYSENVELNSILGIPPPIIGMHYSNAILADIKSFGETKTRGGFKKQFLTPMKKIGAGGDKITYQSLEASEFSKFKMDVENNLKNPNNNVVVSNSSLEAVEINPAGNNDEFSKNISEIYPNFIAMSARIPSYMLLPPNSVNRSVVNDQFMQWIQEVVQPRNNQISEVLNNMFIKFCKASGLTPEIEITLDNPKQQLQIDKNLKDLTDAVAVGLITEDEWRSELNLNKKTQTQPLTQPLV